MNPPSEQSNIRTAQGEKTVCRQPGSIHASKGFGLVSTGLLVALIAGIFFIDRNSPFGITVHVLYILPIYLASIRRNATWLFSVTSCCIILALIGIGPPNDGVPVFVVAANRAIGISVLGIVAFLLHIRANHESRVLQLNEKILSANREAARALKSRNRMLAILGHDVRSPLATIDSLLSMATGDIPRKEMGRLLGEINKNTRRMLVLLGDLMEWSKAGYGYCELIPCNLSGMVSASLVQAIQRAEEKQIRIVNEVGADIFALAEPNILRTVVRNLVTNAIKFTRRTGEIRLFSKDERTSVLLFIEDSGVGIEQERIGRLFDLDAKKTTPGTENEPGSGLGLAFCYDLVAGMGGEITCKSEINNGSVFCVRLLRCVISTRSEEIRKAE